MQMRVITIRPRTTAGAVVVGAVVVAAGAALLAIGAVLLVGVAAVGATAGIATLAYRRLTGERSVERPVGGTGLPSRLGLDPRLEIQPLEEDGRRPTPLRSPDCAP